MGSTKLIDGRPALAAFAFALALTSFQAAGQSVKVTDAWVRPPVPGQKTAAAYVELTSDRAAALVAAGSPAAARVEMHSTSTEGGVMRMRAVPRIELPPGQTVKLAPGGTHLMLFELKQSLKPGEKIPLTLSVQPTNSGAGMSLTTLSVEAEVRMAPAGGSSHQHHR